MNTVKIIQGEHVSPDFETVLGLMNCEKSNPVYEEIKELYDTFFETVTMQANPKAVIAFGFIPIEMGTDVLPAGKEVLYLIATIGDEVSKCSREHFAKGNFLEGMLLDAMADSCLFRFEETVLTNVKAICKNMGKGVAHRYEAPVDIPMELQKEAFVVAKADEALGLRITSGYMYDPIKSVCQVFELTTETERFELEHDCARCPNVKCSLRQVYSMILKVRTKDGEKAFTVKKGENLLSVLQKYGYMPNAVCGGNGTCGKCKVEIEGIGKQLACKTLLYDDMTVVLENEGEAFVVLGDVSKHSTDVDKTSKNASEKLAVAVDIGTTTLAFSLVDFAEKRIIDTYTSINHQRVYGADVITRMVASNNGDKETLQKCIRDDLRNGLEALLQQNDVKLQKIALLVLSGNTTMGHLLMGYSCESLGVYPFTPVNVRMIQDMGDVIMGDAKYAHIKTVYLPGISTFVGADIVSGLYQCDFLQKDKPCLLIDLGTNGEMAIGMKDRILVTSTAAGPAFEGGNIEYGVGSVKGAICSVEIDENAQCKCCTIANGMPIGICGTGVIEAIAELRKAGLVDETGLLTEEYFEDGFPLALAQDGTEIVITQKDIREIQLAKAAIRAGLETLIHRYGTSYEEIECVYIAGGFGYFMDIQKATLIGMLPNELREKTIAAGNTSLNGAIKYILQENAKEKCHEIVNISEEISLATDKEFQEFYMEYMLF